MTIAGPRGALWQTARYARNPQAFYLRCVARYGDTFTVPTVLGPVVAISRPADLRSLFSLRPSHFERWSVEAVEPLLGTSSVLLTSGKRHLRQRRMMAPAFHRERLSAIGAQCATIARAHAARWPRDCAFKLQERMIELSIDVVLRTVLGIVEDPRRAQLRAAILDVLGAMGTAMMLARLVHEQLRGLPPPARFMRARAALDRLLFQEIDSTREPEGGASDSMLVMLAQARDERGAGFGREELRDQLMTLIFAGHETSAIALTWAVYWLHRNPRALARLRDELSNAGDLRADALVHLPYLDAVCKETLRLCPVVAEVIRRLKVPLELERVALPAGTAVAACIVATHHREDIYAEPAQFAPERFFERRPEAHEYLPFGGGLHRCAGEAFAWLEMKAILAELVMRHRFSLFERRAVAPRLRSITMEPRGGVRVAVHRRSH